MPIEKLLFLITYFNELRVQVIKELVLHHYYWDQVSLETSTLRTSKHLLLLFDYHWLVHVGSQDWSGDKKQVMLRSNWMISWVNTSESKRRERKEDSLKNFYNWKKGDSKLWKNRDWKRVGKERMEKKEAMEGEIRYM